MILHMHDREAAAQNLSAVQMELDDLASDLLLSKTPSAINDIMLQDVCHTAAALLQCMCLQQFAKRAVLQHSDGK